MKFRNIYVNTGAVLVVTFIALASMVHAQTIEAPEIYNDGLVATIYIEEKGAATWAREEASGIPIGSYVDAQPPVFGYSSLKQDDEALNYLAGSRIGIQWDGFFKISEGGQQVFGIDARVNGGRFYANSCTMNYNIAGQSIMKSGFKLPDDYRDIGNSWKKSDVTTLNLDEGIYPVSMWLDCGPDSDDWDNWVKAFDRIAFTLKIKRPSDRFIQPMPKGMLIWK